MQTRQTTTTFPKNTGIGTPFTPDVAVVEEHNYYPFGLEHKEDQETPTGDDYPYKYNGKELEEALGLDWYDYGARWYDATVGRWLSVDPLAEETMQPYSYANNNPIRYTDPTGMAPDDFVMRADGSIYWDKNANSQATTKAGETYLGKTLEFTFNSYIDAGLWDGPMGNGPAGDKLTSTITVTGYENSAGELTGIGASSTVNIGETPLGTARGYFPGLGDNQNNFSYSQTNAGGELASFNLNFKQHASVSPIEAFGLNVLGYDIVNVAQKLNLSLSGNQLSIKAGTDIFPSATLSVDGIQLFKYNQPSFKATHGIQRVRTGARIPSNPMNDGFIIDYSYKHSRPAPSFYNRYNN